MSGTMVLGIGNRLGGDDAAGTLVVDMLDQSRDTPSLFLTTEFTAIDAGTAPESYTSAIRRQQPQLLILVDAADMALPPGSLRRIAPEKISILSFSTHSMPLSVFVSYVEKFCGKLVLVGVQSQQIETGMGISKAVRKSVKRLAETILEGRVAEIPLLG
jgi:hydrogenase 3 maturation protease